MIELTEEEYHELSNDYCGICLNCEEIRYMVEPDARNYDCESCGENMVFGIDELLLEGKLFIC